MPDRRRQPQPTTVPGLATLATLGLAALGLSPLLAACGGPAARPVAVTSSATPAPVDDARSMLASRAAAAKDRRYMAGYALTRPGRRTLAVMTTLAGDGTWRVDLQGGALSGTVDVAVVGRPDGQYQCALASASAGCVRVAALDHRISSSVDPLVELPFTTWIGVFTDPSVAITVVATDKLAGATGDCFAVEPTTVTLAPPIESAVVCYAQDGTLTAARGTFGTLMITGSAVAAPPTVPLPAPVVGRAALPIIAPPAPATGAGTSARAAPTRTP